MFLHVVWTIVLSILGMDKLFFSIPDIDNVSTYHIEKLSICCIDKKCFLIRHIHNLSISGINKLSLSGINEHNVFYIAHGKFVYISHKQLFSLHYVWKIFPYAI